MEHIPNIINMFLLFATAYGAYMLYQQWQTDHERSRKSFAVELMMKWVDNLHNNSFGVRRFVESLEKENCEKLEKAEAFQVDANQLQLAKYVLKREFPEAASLTIGENGEKAKICTVHSLFIRSMAIKYLNLLECIMAAWDHGFADRSIIESEFRPIVIGDNDQEIAMKYLRLAGDNSFPSLNRFIAHVENPRSAVPNPSGRLKRVANNVLTKFRAADSAARIEPAPPA